MDSPFGAERILVLQGSPPEELPDALLLTEAGVALTSRVGMASGVSVGIGVDVGVSVGGTGVAVGMAA